MRILMLSPNPLTSRLGAAKVLIELSGELRRIEGVECELAGPEELGIQRTFDANGWMRFSESQRRFIHKRGGEFDVIDYDHEHLPYARAEFDPRAPMVARSVLLVHHLQTIRVPTPLTPRSFVGRVLRGRARRSFQNLRISSATRTVEQADLINVSNDHDQRELVRCGIDAAKIVVLPFGLSAARREQFERACGIEPPAEPVIAFVGTFDYRKGAADFPRLVRLVCDAMPAARFRLIGTAGMFATADQVLSHFPRALRSRIDVHPRFEPDELPALLRDCSVGVFPSYMEGFGFGVLEMLAAAVPVIAYDSPGPPMMLDRECLVPAGDVSGMSGRVVELLRDRAKLSIARRNAREYSRRFDWREIARQTVAAYRAARPAIAMSTPA
jgi:glycosyltransferase involved in cell wall biosynthesis